MAWRLVSLEAINSRISYDRPYFMLMARVVINWNTETEVSTNVSASWFGTGREEFLKENEKVTPLFQGTYANGLYYNAGTFDYKFLDFVVNHDLRLGQTWFPVFDEYDKVFITIAVWND